MISGTRIQYISILCSNVPFYPDYESDPLTAKVGIMETLGLVITEMYLTGSVTHVEAISSPACHQGCTACHSAIDRSWDHVPYGIIHRQGHCGICGAYSYLWRYVMATLTTQHLIQAIIQALGQSWYAPTNESRRYNVTTSLISWVQNYTDSCLGSIHRQE